MNWMTNTLAALVLALAFTSPAMATNERININTADVATLDRVLDGVGPAKAAAIVEHRRVNGAFRSIDQLVNVKGIGIATVERNRNRIMVGGTAAAASPVRAAAPASRPAPAPRVH
jgi:competence protein ComEA